MASTDFVEGCATVAYRYGGTCYDECGQRVALITTTGHYAGRFSSLGGWTDGESYTQSATFVAENGRELAPGEWVTTDQNDLRRFDGNTLAMAGVNCTPATPAQSDWYPIGAIRPDADGVYPSEWDCEAAWEAAFADRRAAKAAAKAAPSPTPSPSPSPSPEKVWTLADLATMAKRK